MSFLCKQFSKWTLTTSSGLNASKFHTNHSSPRLSLGAPSHLAWIRSRGMVRHALSRWYSPLTSDEEEKEKARVLHLSPEQKEMELRKLNREIAKLEVLRGINTGELYTWSGRYKNLLRDYGFPLLVYYWATWGTTGLVAYLAIDIGGLDAMQLIAKADSYTGWDLVSKVDPELGKIGLALMLNEMLEPIRLPFVVATLKPLIETINPPKY